jgi:hypothetical protein
VSSIWVLTTLIAGLLVLVSFAQPVADRLQLPYTVLLSIPGRPTANRRRAARVDPADER